MDTALQRKTKAQALAGLCSIENSSDPNATHLCVVSGELKRGLQEIASYDKAVTIYGSARLSPETQAYQDAKLLATGLARQGYTVVNGGGPGIMEAVSKGAHEAGGQTVGVTIHLPHEQTTNPYITHEIPFEFFFTRKAILAHSADCFIAFPGGFGTLDELCEVLTLIQNKKIKRVPVILFDSNFWQPFDRFIKDTLLAHYHTINDTETTLYTITDSIDEILALTDSLS